MTVGEVFEHLVELQHDLPLELRGQTLEHASVEALVSLLAELRETRKMLTGVEKDVEAAIVEVAPKKGLVVPGVGSVEIHKRTNRAKWDTDALLPRVVSYALDERILDLETGEYETDFSAVARVIKECARLEWRLTPLRARKIDPDEYCEQEDAGYSVRIA